MSSSDILGKSRLVRWLGSAELVARFQGWVGLGHPFFHPLFKFGTQLGDELFYAFWFSNWFWNIDGAVGRRVILIWAIHMYCGQGLKDLFRIPRPASPPVTQLESKWSLEYGFPSTHAVVGAAVPFATIFFTSTRYTYPIPLGILVAVLWATLVSTSRIYLGMHSILDILGGLGLVAVLFIPTLPLVDYLDPLILTSPYGGVLFIAVTVLLCLVTPGGERWTPARGDTIVIVGSATGFMVGSWLNYQLGLMTPHPPPLPPPYHIIWPSASMALTALLRLAIGLPIVGITRQVAKPTLNKLFTTLSPSVWGQFPVLATKYVTYLLMTLNIVLTSPILFKHLNIQRTTFHTEF